MLPNFAYVKADSVQQAVGLLSTDGVKVHAGGTDLLGCLHDHVFSAQTLVSISSIQELKGIQQTPDGGVRIGALTTITEVAEHPLLRRDFAALAQAAGEVASPQLRNQGTIGGNICQKPRCWYYRGEFLCLRKGGDVCYAVLGENQYHCIFGGSGCYIVHPSDTAPALIALEAKAVIVGPDKTRAVPLEDFHVLPSDNPEKETVLKANEIVSEVILPRPPDGLRSSYRKVRARRSWDFALAGVALALQLSDHKVTHARVVLSGVAPVPWQAKEVEQLILGKPLDAELIRKAATSAVADAQPLEYNGYKVALLRGVIEEELSRIAHA